MDEHSHDHADGGHDHGFECGVINEFNGKLGLRISAIFVIGFGSMLGMLIILHRPRQVATPAVKTRVAVAEFFATPCLHDFTSLLFTIR